MSRKGRNDQPGTKPSSPWDRAGQAAAQVKPVAPRLKPLARSTGAAARRRAHKTRAWAAPQVEHAGQVLQDSVAPKVSALLSAARRLEPAKPRRRRWRKLAGVSMLEAAASAVAAVVRNRRKPEVTTPAAGADADDVTPAAEMRDGQGRTGTGADAGVNRPVPPPDRPPAETVGRLIKLVTHGSN